MQQAGICFKIDEVEGEAHYIAPDHLPPRQEHSELNWAIKGPSRTLTFEALPPGFMRGLLVRIGQSAGARGRYWQNGFLGFDAETGSRVSVLQERNTDWTGRITLEAEGADPMRLLKKMVRLVDDEASRFGIKPSNVEQKSEEDETEMPDFQKDPKTQSFFVSYAWSNEDNPERAKIVDEFCERAKDAGIHIRRDKDEVKIGQSISEFMAELVDGDRIVIVLSDKYLHSRFCMHELYEIWVRAKANDTIFREKVRLYTSPDAQIRKPVDRAKIARYWRQEYDEELEYLVDMSASDRVGHTRLGKFATHVAEILSAVDDTLQPRSLDKLVDYALD